MVLRLLFPLGLLALLGILLIFLIHVINPKYQDKIVSSTYIWKKALKMKKKRLPIDRFSNLILFFTQCLILALCAMALASPNLFTEQSLRNDMERIVVIEASAGMRAKYLGDEEGETRFQRAIDEVRVGMNDVLMRQNGFLTIIIADDEPYYLFNGASMTDYSDVVRALDGLECPMCKSDMQTAIEMAQERMLVNPASEVYVYSGTEYGFTGDAVTTVNVADFDHEWNIGILGCEVAVEENEYIFHAELGAYGKIAVDKTLCVDIYGARNGSEEGTHDYTGIRVPVTFVVNTESPGMELKQTVDVRATDLSIGGKTDWFFSSYERVELRIADTEDSISEDDTLVVYGGEKDPIRIQYYSTNPNTFYFLVFSILRDEMRLTRDIVFDQVTDGDPKNEGYDIYLFEHAIPKIVLEEGLPKDGIVFLFDPDIDEESLEGLGYKFGEEVTPDSFTYFREGSKGHPLTQSMQPNRIGVSCYKKFESFDETFVPVMYCDEDPIVIAKNMPDSKLIVMPFSINYSNFSVQWDFMIFLYNAIDYYLPLTLEEHSFELGDSAAVHCKGTTVSVSDGKGEATVLKVFPQEYTFRELGTYTFTTDYSLEKEDEVRKVYVKIPASASAIFGTSDVRAVIDKIDVLGELATDLFVYFAAALVVFLFVESYLQYRSDYY